MMRLTFTFSSFFVFLLAAAQQPEALNTYQSPLAARIEHVFISSDSQSVIAADSAGYVFFWHKQDGSLAKIMRAHNHSIRELALSGDGKYFATTSSDNHIYLWDFHTGQKTAELLPQSPCTMLEFSADNNALVYSAGEVLYKAGLPQLDKPVEIFRAQAPITCGEAIQGGYFAINSGDLLKVLSPDGVELSNVKTCGAGVFLQARGNYLLNVCDKSEVELFGLKGMSLHSLKHPTLPFIPKEQVLLGDERFALFSSGVDLLIWDWRSNTNYHSFSLPLKATALGSAGQYILTGDDNGQVLICKNPIMDDLQRPAEKTKAARTSDKPAERKVRAKESVDVQSAQLDVFVWDDERLDGDTISLSLNGKWILTKYMVTNEKKKLTLTLEPGKKNTLVLYAENLGKVPPNSAVISFNDGTKQHTLTLNSDMKRSDAVNFIIKK